MSDEASNVADSAMWLEVVAAVEYLGATHRPGLTVWDALAEAVRWWIEDEDSRAKAGRERYRLPWSDSDPMRTAMELLLRTVPPAGTPDGHDLPAVIDGALRSWLEGMAAAYNDDRPFAPIG